MDEQVVRHAARGEAVARRSPRPFVGRVRELSELVSGLGEAASGRGAVVLLAGEPGIGKTRLMSELARLGEERGVRVVAGRCWEEGGAPPYWPWIQVLRFVGGDFEELAGSADRGGVVASQGERLRLFDDVARFLTAASSERPLLVTLDDVHAADEPSLLLLRFLGDALSDAGVLLVAAYREGEPRVRELADIFGELTRVGRRMSLRGLAPAEIEAYVASVSGSRPTQEVVARLHEITAGNPFFVGEVVRLLDATAALDDAIKDPLRRVPEEVRALIRRRIASLEAEAVAVLRVAAVIGREFDLHLLQQTSRLTAARLLEVLGEAVALGVVVELPAAPRYSFAHELVRETLYDDLPPARRLELHQQVGGLLENVYTDDDDPHLSEIARHLYLAAPLGDAGAALDYLVRAGDRASALVAYEEAAVHYRRALELLTPAGDGTVKRRTELLLRLGDAQWRSGDGTQARVTFEQAIEAARRLGSGEVLAEAALGYVTALGGFLLYARFEVGATGVGLLEEALAALPPSDSPLRARLLAHLALEMWSGNEPVERRVGISQEALDMARRLGDSEALVTALHARHWALTTPGMAHQRLVHTEEMLRVAKETENPEIEFLAHNARFHCFLELCDRRGMDAENHTMSELAERLRQPFFRWHTVCLRTLRATLDGRFQEAEQLAQEALELGRVRQSEYATYVFRYAQLLAIRWAQGRLNEVWPETSEDVERSHAERFPWIPRWRDALAAAELGNAEAARREIERHAGNEFGDLPRDGLWILHICALAEACVLVRDEPHARRLYELLLPHAEDNAISYTQQPFGPVGLHLGRLAALFGDWQEVDRHFASALARCELLGARAIRARVLFEYAAALDARGEAADRGRLEAMVEEATQLCEELGLPDLAARYAVAPPRVEAAVFRRDGEFWTISYGGETFRLRDVKGLGYIATLLASPGRELHVLELAGAATAESQGGPVLDEQAKREYARRLTELEEEHDEAERWGDTERAARRSDEIDLLTQELAHAVGLRGRDRTFASPAERARISVTKAIRTAIKLVDKQSAELASHLDSSIQTGGFCSYAPRGAVPPPWNL